MSGEFASRAAAGAVLKPEVAVGEVLEIPLTIPGDFGRMAAQTAKQVIIQKIREAERTSIIDEYGGKEGDRINDHHISLEEKRTAKEMLK